MARNVFPGMKTGGGILSKVIGTAIVMAIIVMVIKHPADSASFAKELFGGAGAVIDGFVSFFRSLTG
jgi:hypothetical protein